MKLVESGYDKIFENYEKYRRISGGSGNSLSKLFRLIEVQRSDFKGKSETKT